MDSDTGREYHLFSTRRSFKEGLGQVLVNELIAEVRYWDPQLRFSEIVGREFSVKRLTLPNDAAFVAESCVALLVGHVLKSHIVSLAICVHI